MKRNILKENMRRFNTKNLKEQEDKGDVNHHPNMFRLTNREKYDLLSSGQATSQDIAQIIKSAIGYNDDEAVMQAAVSAIKDKVMYDEVSTYLKLDLVKWLLKNYSNVTGNVVNAKSIYDYTEDKIGTGRIETIQQSLKRLGVDSIDRIGYALERGMKTFG